MSDSSKNIAWINYVKTIGIVLVYFFHVENRIGFGFCDRAIDVYFQPFFVNVFFVVSGFLLYKKCSEFRQKNGSCFLEQHKEKTSYLENIFFKFIVPSILFSAILFFPKMIIRNQPFEVDVFLFQTIGGYTMWFVSALAVAEILLLPVLCLKKHSVYIWLLWGTICFIFGVFLHYLGLKDFPWRYQAGMCAVLFMAFGALLYKVDFVTKLNPVIRVFALLIYIMLLYFYTFKNDLSSMEIDVPGFFIALLGSLVLISFCSIFKQRKTVDRIGRSTIGLYFLSGAVPEFVAVIVKKIVEVNNGVLLISFVVSFVLAVFVNELLLRFVGFIFDFRKVRRVAE